MLGWALTFLIVAIVAAVFGFGGIATTAAGPLSTRASEDQTDQKCGRDDGSGIARRGGAEIAAHVDQRRCDRRWLTAPLI